MSSVADSRKKANAVQEDAEAYDPYPGFDFVHSCAEIPWPEWSDAELNAEVWDEAKVGKGTAAGPKNASPAPEAPSPFFVDPAPPTLPPPISDYVKTWRKPTDLFSGADFVVYDPSNADFELQVPSTLSSECNFLKAFMEQITVLQFYACKHGFPVEMESASFAANTQGEPWRPWHLVYALCKAGKGQPHKPLYCPYGKYVVRLFYMGTWRKFTVDDRIPCDAEGSCMLPISQTPGELWPIILSKALLKILSLTPTGDFSATDFPFVSCLTAWTHNHVTTQNKSNDQLWRRFTALQPRYQRPENDESEGNKRTDPSKGDSRKTSIVDVAKSERFCFLFANLIGFEEDVPAHRSVAITMTRDRPLVKVSKREETKPWKRIRWIYWAKERGLWVDENQLPPYRRLLVVTVSPEIIDQLTPDPKLEAATYNLPVEENSGADEEAFAEEDRPFEPEQWCDFNSLVEFLLSFDVFFKPSIFSYNFKVTCVNRKISEVSQGGKTASKPAAAAPPPPNSFLLPMALKQTLNEPGVLFCESVTGIFLCFSLWVHPEENKTCAGYLDADQPAILKVGHASLVIEVLDWATVHQGEVVGVMKTVGYSSYVLNLNPGRHIFKLWIDSDSPYVLDIFSNASVTVAKSLKIRNLMIPESQTILNYINNVSNVFIALTQKFGKPDLPAALRDFYEAILKPKNDIAENYRKNLDEFIESFLQCILLTLKDSIANAEELAVTMWALRCLFINPHLQYDVYLGGVVPSFVGGGAAKKTVTKKVAPVTETVDRTLSEILDSVSFPEDVSKVVMIQKVFRGYRVRLLWKCQTPTRKEFKPYGERLKKICDALFVPQKREAEVGKLLRRLLTKKPHLFPTFRFYRDFFNVLQVDEFGGKVPNVEPFAWVPIARFVVASHCEEPVPCGFYFYCNLEQSVVQGFDNDSGAEIFRVANTVSPHYYHGNVKGYTIFVFGWNEASAKTVNWKLQMVKMKYFQSLHLCNLLMTSICTPCANLPSVDLCEVKNFYVPNSRSRILRCLIKIQKRTLLSLRLALSCTEVEFSVVVTLDKKYCDPNFGTEASTSDRVIADVTSVNGAVILPWLILEYVENPFCGESLSETNHTVYVLEAYVLNNSWPLTKQEWGLIEPLRVNGETWAEGSTVSLLSKKGGAGESRKKSNRNFRRTVSEQKIENPFWWVQALLDASPPDALDSAVIEEDKSYAESIRAMKIYWEEKDPGRRKRGAEMRKKFLYAMYLEERKNDLFYGEYMGEDAMPDEPILDEQAVVDRLSSFSYLIGDSSATRYTYSPRILPVMPLNELLCRYRLYAVSSLSQEDGKDTNDTQSSDFNSKTVYDVVEVVEIETRQFMKRCTHYRSLLSGCVGEEQKLSVRLMEQAYEARAKCIERMSR